MGETNNTGVGRRRCALALCGRLARRGITIARARHPLIAQML